MEIFKIEADALYWIAGRVKAQLECIKELCKGRNNLYEKQKDKSGFLKGEILCIKKRKKLIK